MRISSPLVCLVLAALPAFVLVLFESAYRDEHFVQCQVRVETDTVFSLYTNTGRGYSEDKVVRGALFASPLWQAIKFKVDDVFFKDLRLDFDTRSKTVSVRSCRLQDEYGLDLDQNNILSISPLHQVEIIQEGKNGSSRIRANGEDPQMRLSLNVLSLYVQNIQTGFFLAAILLCYPLSCLMFAILARCIHGKIRRKQSRRHRLFLAASLFMWALVPLAYWAAVTRNEVQHIAEGAESVPVPGEFQGRELVLHRLDGLAISGRLYQQKSQAPVRGNILLLHGNYPQGQMFPLYPLMAEELAERGFRILTIDFAGFGQSADPFASEQYFRSDLESETELALDYLKDIAEQGAKLIIIGHSMGANPALRVGLRDSDVDALILIGPPRRVAERFHHRGDLAFFWNWALGISRSQYGREQFPSWYTQEHWQTYFLEHDMVHMLPQLRAWCHKPLYLLDGGGEPAEDRVFLKSYAAQVSSPCTYLTLNGADHNMNVLAFQTKPGYEPSTLQHTADIIEKWCEYDGGPRGVAWSLLHNCLRLLFPFR